eukprot:1318042-Amorphochlora_amoeboformis.AAC.2
MAGTQGGYCRILAVVGGLGSAIGILWGVKAVLNQRWDLLKERKKVYTMGNKPNLQLSYCSHNITREIIRDGGIYTLHLPLCCPYMPWISLRDDAL